MQQATSIHAQANNARDFHGEKILLYRCSDLQILVYLLNAVKPIVTGEMYTTNKAMYARKSQITGP